MSEAIAKPLQTYKNWFFFTILYLVIDYGRPQDILHIDFLKPGMFSIAILAGYLLFSGKIRETLSRQTGMMWLFIILLAIFVPFARNNYFAYIATKDIFLFMPFVLSVIICVNSMERLKKLIFICVCIMIYIAVYSLLHHGVGSGNYFADENDVSLYINMWVPFCYFLFASEKEKIRKIVYGSGLILGISAVVVSFSRGGFIGLVSIAFVSWLFSQKKVASLIVICLLALIIYAYAGDAYWTRISTTTETDQGTAAIRLESWKAGWKMFLDHPLGVGGNNFQVRFPEYQSDFFKRGMWGRAAHSIWFTLLPELGISGIIIYFLLLYHNLKDIFRLRMIKTADNPDLQYMHSLSSAFLASLAGYFASGTFISVLYYPHYWYLTGIIVATARVAKDILKAEEIPIQKSNTMNWSY